MIWFRQGVAWIPNADAIARQAKTLRINALTLHVDDVAFLPALLSRVTFDALLGGERVGPLEAEVVHVSGNAVSLQLDDDARDALLRLGGLQPPQRARTRTSGGTPVVEEIPAAPEGSQPRQRKTTTAVEAGAFFRKRRRATGAQKRAEAADSVAGAPSGGASAAPQMAPRRSRYKATVATTSVPPGGLHDGSDSAATAAGSASASASAPGATEPGTPATGTGSHPAVASGSAAAARGQLVSRIGLGGIDALFDDRPVEAPGNRTSLVALLRYLHQNQAEGTLVVTGETYTKRVAFARGTPLSVTVKPFKEDEQLGQLLIKARWITPHRLADVMRRARVNRIAIGQALIESGVLDEAKLNRALAHQTYRRLQDLFTWNKASFEFEPGQPELQQRVQHPVAVPRLLHEVARDILRLARLDDLLVLIDAYMERYPRLAKVSPKYIKTLVGDDKTLRVARQIFAGGRSLRTAITASVLGRPRTVQLVHYLIAARALDLPLDPSTSAAFGRRELEEQHRTIEVQNYFQRLGLPYAVHPSEIEAAYDKRRTEFEPGAPLRRVNPEMCDRILRLLEEAQLALSATTTRRRYRERTLGAEKMAVFSKVLSEAADLARLHGHTERAQRLEAVLEELAPA